MDSKLIRFKPKFEMYIENDNLIIYNEDYRIDNSIFKLNEIKDVELIFNKNWVEKIITVLFLGWEVPKNTVIMKIYIENGIKEIMLTDCNIGRVELIYNQIISRINYD